MSTSAPYSFRTDIQSGTLVVVANADSAQPYMEIRLKEKTGNKSRTLARLTPLGSRIIVDAHANIAADINFPTMICDCPVEKWISSDYREEMYDKYTSEPDFTMETELGTLCVYAYHDREFSLYINLAAEKSGEKRIYCVAIIREPEKDYLSIDIHTDPDWCMLDGKFNQRCIFPVKLWKEAGLI